ncbi:MAG: SLOG family protein [Clostridia bacterium]|nr:SLOG family protein [Clostridia bacterium]
MTDNTCAFTGHRQLGDDFDIRLLDNVILSLVKRGTENFLCGMAKGFDLAAAELVLKYKREYGLKLTACIPFDGQGDGMYSRDREKYYNVLEGCDEKIIFSDHYSIQSMHARDRYMVDNCDVLVSYLRKEKGGTFYTVKYAHACGRKIIEV